MNILNCRKVLEADWLVGSCRRRVKENVESCDLFITDDNHIRSRIGQHTAGGGQNPTKVIEAAKANAV